MMNRKAFLGRLATGFSTLLFPVHLPAITQPKKIKILECEVRGMYYYDYNAVRHTLREKAFLHLQREPNNPHDCKAVAVYFQSTKLGYLPRELNQAVANLIDAGMKMQVQATFVYFDRVKVEVMMSL